MQVHIKCIEAQNLPKMDLFGSVDCYCVFSITSCHIIQRTKTIDRNYNPIWNQIFHFPINDPTTDILTVYLKDEDKGKADDAISKLIIYLRDVPYGQIFDKWYDPVPVKGVKKGGRLHLILHVCQAGAIPFEEITCDTSGTNPARKMEIPEVQKIDTSVQQQQPSVIQPPIQQQLQQTSPQMFCSGTPESAFNFASHNTMSSAPQYQTQGYPNGYLQQPYPNPPQPYPPQGYPSQGYPPQGYPPQGYPPQGYPSQGYSMSLQGSQPSQYYSQPGYQIPAYHGTPTFPPPQGYPNFPPPQNYQPNQSYF